MNSPVVLSRRELYDLVWSKPMRDLAAEFGISDVGLAKVCDRHRVPKPQRGHWAKLAAGKKVKQALFVAVDDARLDRIEIQGARSELPEEAKRILEAARAQRVPLRPRAPVSRPDVAVIAEVHATVAPTARKLRAAHGTSGAAAFGEGLCGVDVAVGQVERAVTFLDGLARRLDAKALPLKPTGQGMKVVRGADEAIFTLKERTRREKHVPTPAELAEDAKRQRKLQSSWDSTLFGRSYLEFDTIYTGGFVFQIDGYSDGIRRRWADGRTQTVETLLDSIVTGIEALLAVRKSERERRERSLFLNRQAEGLHY